MRAAGRQYKATHITEGAETNARLRARKMNAPVVEKVDRAAIIERDKGTCYLCGARPTGRNLTLDHVVALSAGGEHSASNLRVACHPCNRRKGARPLAPVE